MFKEQKVFVRKNISAFLAFFLVVPHVSFGMDGWDGFRDSASRALSSLKKKATRQSEGGDEARESPVPQGFVSPRHTARSQRLRKQKAAKEYSCTSSSEERRYPVALSSVLQKGCTRLNTLNASQVGRTGRPMEDLAILKFRNECIVSFGTTLPSESLWDEVLNPFLEASDHVLSVCSGCALWERFLQEKGVDIIATDLNPGYYGQGKCYMPVKRKGAYEAVETFSERNVLFISFHSDSSVSHDIFEVFQGNKVIVLDIDTDFYPRKGWENVQDDYLEDRFVDAEAFLGCYKRVG